LSPSVFAVLVVESTPVVVVVVEPVLLVEPVLVVEPVLPL